MSVMKLMNRLLSTGRLTYCNQRGWVFALVWFCLAALFQSACVTRAIAQQIHQVQAKSQPDVLFIAVDDLNDWVNCLGGRAGVHTPNLDRLAGCGVLFTNAHCAAPSCNPSRVAMMTGVRPSTSGIYHNGQDWRESPRLAKAVTLPQHFRASGYRAIGGGKLFHALSWITDSYGKQQNDPKIWDDYFPSKTKPMPDALWPSHTKMRVGKTGYVFWDPIAKGAIGNGQVPKGRPAHFFDWGPIGKDQKESEMSDAKVVDWAIGAMNEKPQKQGRSAKEHQPVFQAVGIFRPHIPWFAPGKYFHLYPYADVKLPKFQPGDLDDCSPVGRRFTRRSWHKWLVDQDAWRGAVQGYLASISFADAQVGRLLDALDKQPRGKETIVVLWSDHGMHIGEKEHWEKFTLWEESTRVPLIIIAPGVTKAGGRCDRPVNLVDVYPTLVELCNLPKRDDLDGVSLLPLLKDPAAKWDRASVTTWGQNNHGVRSQHYRYIRYHNGDEELYDHRVDPDEFKNLLAVTDDAAATKAARDKWRSVIDAHAKWIPKVNVKSIGKPGKK
jgi:arylsulfatase A-like enzyme